jgi:hypothetical protein
MWLILVLIFTIIIVALFIINKGFTYNEHFNEQMGRFCGSCSERTFGQCLQCFNCSWCVDKFGNGRCIGGDVNGPYNYEKCALYYNSDPFNRMKYNNSHYKCSYGPIQANRIIGI